MPTRSEQPGLPSLPGQPGGSAQPGKGNAGAVPDAIIALVEQDLQSRLGRTNAQSRVVLAESVTWNDGSLGCPVPGQLYTQALVPGYRVIMEVGGTQYDYRSSQTGPVRLCAPFQPSISKPSP